MLVKIYGSAWDYSRTPISSRLDPRLWIVARRPRVTRALNVSTEVLCDLNVGTGQFEAEVESEPGLEYFFRMDWLLPGQEDEPPERRARGYEEWPETIRPGNGGLVGDLIDTIVAGAIHAGYGPSPADAPAWFDLLDVTSEGVMLYATEGTD